MILEKISFKYEKFRINFWKISEYFSIIFGGKFRETRGNLKEFLKIFCKNFKEFRGNLEEKC